MEKARSLHLNKTRADEFLKSLDDKPKFRTAIVYQAIIASLVAHIFILFVTQMLTQDNRMAEEEVIYEELQMEMLEADELPPPPEPKTEENLSQELRNLVANENSERSTEAKSYRGMTAAQINEQVYNELKNMEAEEFARLKEGQPDYTINQKQQGDKSNSQEKTKSEYDWYKEKANNKSYDGLVTASYNMKGRDALDNPVPTYRCKTRGQVIVLVTINNMGQVTDAKIDASKSSADECLQIESQKYALKWKFNYKQENKKQDGTITFTFSAQ